MHRVSGCWDLNGVFKRLSVVAIKITREPTIEEIQWAFTTVLADVTGGSAIKPAVAVFSFNSYMDPDPYEWQPVRLAIQEIFNAGGSVTVSSGNGARAGRRQLVDTLPAAWSDNSFPLIVAGAVDDFGTPAPFSQGGGHVTTWAPGVEVQCAAKGNDLQLANGTSYSNGMVRKCTFL